MIKKFGYGDNIRNLSQKDDIELLDKRDYRTAWDINRPIINIYNELESVYDFLNSFADYQLTDTGVFTNSLTHQFDITNNDSKRVTLYDKRDEFNITSVQKVYTKIQPGIAGFNHDGVSQTSLMIVNKPTPREMERVISEVLGLFYHNEEEKVEVKYNQISNKFKCKISKRFDPMSNITSKYFGATDINWNNDLIDGIDSLALLEELYNSNEFNAYFVNAFNGDLTKFSLDNTITEVTTTGIKYWKILEDQILLSSVNDGFFLGSLNFTSLNPLTITSIDKNHVRYGEKVRIDVHGTLDTSFQVNTTGGIDLAMSKGIRIKNTAGSEFFIDTAGNLTQTIIGTSIETITGKKTIQANNELELNGPLLDVNNVAQTFDATTQNNTIATQTNNITTKNDTIGTKNESVTLNEIKTVGGASTETVTGRKTSGANEQRINGTVDIVFASPSIVFDTGVNGTISFIGKNQLIEGDTVRLGDNIIELNKNQTGVPAAGLFSGMEINRGTEIKAQFLFRENDDTWINGLVGSLKAIANREDNSAIINNGIPSWDNVDKIFKTSSRFMHNRTNGTLTVNVDVPATTVPLVTNSTAKVINLNVDQVDGVDINNTGAANGELAIWSGTNIIGTSNKLITILGTLAGNSDDNIPTEKAVKTYVDGGLSLKANINSPTFTGTVGGITKAMVGLGNVDNTADAVKNVLYAATAGSSNQVRSVNFHADAVDPTGTTRLNMDGYLYATRVYNAIWNDIAEYMYSDGDCKPGQVMVRKGDKIVPSYKKGDKAIVGVYSDTYGYALGAEDQENKVPIGLCGRIYVWIKEPVEIGDLLISSDSGFSTVLKDGENGTGKVFAKSLKNKTDYKEERIEVLIMMA